MSSQEQYKQVIRNQMSKLKEHVSIEVFTSQNKGTDLKKCRDCDKTMNLLQIYEDNSNGKLTIKERSINENPEYAKEYDIQRVPTILFVNNQGKEVIRYLANPVGPEVQPFVKAIFAFAGAGNYYENAVKNNLHRIPPSTLKVMITMQCPYCPQVVEAANLIAAASNGKIRTVIVDIMANPDIGQYYNAAGVPYTVINERPAISGMINANQLIRELINKNTTIRY
ncbi:MAG: thioredoxin family protein [Promethearchaeia archaeon]